MNRIYTSLARQSRGELELWSCRLPRIGLWHALKLEYQRSGSLDRLLPECAKWLCKVGFYLVSDMASVWAFLASRQRLGEGPDQVSPFQA